jgi:hypothetical protein
MATLLDLLVDLLPDGPPPAGTQAGVVDSRGREYVIEFGEVWKQPVVDQPTFLIGG